MKAEVKNVGFGVIGGQQETSLSILSDHGKGLPSSSLSSRNRGWQEKIHCTSLLSYLNVNPCRGSNGLTQRRRSIVLLFTDTVL